MLLVVIIFLALMSLICSSFAGHYEEDHGSSTYEEKSKPVEIPIYKKYAIPIPHPVPVEIPQEIKVPIPQPYKVPVEIPQPYPVEVVKHVEVPVEKPEPYVVEKHVPYVVEKPYPVYVEKKFPVPVAKPYPVHVPIYKHNVAPNNPHSESRLHLYRRMMDSSTLTQAILASMVVAVWAGYDEDHGGSTYHETSKTVEIPIYKKYAIPIPHPVPVAIPQQIKVPIPQPYQVQVPVPHPVPVEVVKHVEIPVEKPEPYVVEKKVPYVVEKPYAVTVEKHFPVPIPKPYPVHVPVYKHVFHHQSKGHGNTGARAIASLQGMSTEQLLFTPLKGISIDFGQQETCAA
ncbi:titin-like [Vespula maculifrons]|uniref:Titin-like n=1 Tax=Vespula maculifrons TaxID=7453 RepID=A0ABD2AQZ3_VESMC